MERTRFARRIAWLALLASFLAGPGCVFVDLGSHDDCCKDCGSSCSCGKCRC